MTPECSRCRQAMEAGFIVDYGYATAHQPAWIAGAAEWSRWSGLKLKGRRKLPVVTYRCPHCGRLESFAHPGQRPA